MLKRIISMMLIATMLFVTILPVGNVFASEVPTIIVRSGSTIFSNNGTYTLSAGDIINISATPDIQYIKYKVGQGDIVTVNSSSVAITVPSITNEFSLQVYARGDGGSAGWMLYNISVKSEVPEITVKSGSTILRNNGTYTLNTGDKLNISASPNIQYIKYQLGQGSLQTVYSSSVVLTVPDNLTEFSLQVYAKTNANVGSGSEFNYYTIKVPEKIDQTVPEITVKGGSTTFVNKGTYTLNAGDTINISASPDIAYIKYQLGQGTLQTINGSSVVLTVPDNLNEFSLQVYAKTNAGIGSGSEFNYYTIKVPEKVVIAVPTIEVKSGNTTFVNNGTYTLNAGDIINISASPNIEYIKYKLGQGDVVTISKSSVAITVPDNVKEFSLQVYTRGEGGTAGWLTYNLTVPEKVDQTVPEIVVKSGDTTFINKGTYTLNAGDKISISASPNIKYIKYQIGQGTLQTVNDSSIELVVPDNFTEFSLQVFARTNADVGSGEEYNYYTIKVPGKVVIAEPTIEVKSNNATFVPNATYTLDVGDKIDISATPNIEYIKYKIGQGDIVTVNDSSAQITVNDDLEVFTLQVFAKGEGGSVGWITYNIKVKIDEEPDPVDPVDPVDPKPDPEPDPVDPVEPDPKVYPTLVLRDEDSTKLVLNNTNVLNKGEKLKFTASHSDGIKKVTYQFDNGTSKTVYSKEGQISISDNYADGKIHTLSFDVEAKDGTKLKNVEYTFKVLSNSNDYSFILNNDEILNGDGKGLQVSLRTITDKDGNNNVYLVDETIKYYIDFANFGSNISDDVVLEFNVPENVSIKYVDTKEGKIINNKTVRWTLNGLEKNQKGTIVLVLKYTSIPKNSIIIKPTATIEYSNIKDSSAVENLICKSSNITLNLEHKPFMIGDGGTNTFRPTEGLNRAEMAMILTRIFNIQLVNDYTVTYNDSEYISQKYGWAEQAIMTVTKYGLMEGYDDKEFKPAEKVTYAQLMTVIARRFAVENDNNNNVNPFEIKSNPIKLFKMSNTSHWANKYVTQLMRMNMLANVIKVNESADKVINRAEVASLINTCLYRGPSQDGSNGQLVNTFVDVNSRTQYYENIIEASADAHNSRYTSEGIEIIVK